MLSAIIVAAGQSSRAGFDKLFAKLGNRLLIEHTVSAFQRACCVDEIVLVGRDSTIEQMRALRSEFPKIRAIVGGGDRRQDSVQHGLTAISAAADFVAVHDAARPLITPAEIERVFSAVREHGAAALAAPVTDTLKVADAKGCASGSIDRENVCAMQTPQVFARRLLVDAYDRVRKKALTVTDEASAVQHAGGKVALVMTRDYNPKITYPDDLAIAACILEQRDAIKPPAGRKDCASQSRQ